MYLIIPIITTRTALVCDLFCTSIPTSPINFIQLFYACYHNYFNSDSYPQYCSWSSALISDHYTSHRLRSEEVGSAVCHVM